MNSPTSCPRSSGAFGSSKLTYQINESLRRFDKVMGDLSASEIINHQLVQEISRLVPTTYKPICSEGDCVCPDSDLQARRVVNNNVTILLNEMFISDILMKANAVFTSSKHQNVASLDEAIELAAEVFYKLHEEQKIRKKRLAEKQAYLKKLQHQHAQAESKHGYWSMLLENFKRPLRS